MTSNGFISVEFDGLDDLLQQFADAPKQLETVVVKPALRVAARILLKAEQQGAPVASGELRDALRTIVVKATYDGEIVAYVGIPTKLTSTQKANIRTAKRTFSTKSAQTQALRLARPYWVLWQEFGWIDRGGNHHPGTRFIAKATEATQSSVQDTFASEFANNMDKLFVENLSASR